MARSSRTGASSAPSQLRRAAGGPGAAPSPRRPGPAAPASSSAHRSQWFRTLSPPDWRGAWGPEKRTLRPCPDLPSQDLTFDRLRGVRVRVRVRGSVRVPFSLAAGGRAPALQGSGMRSRAQPGSFSLSSRHFVSNFRGRWRAGLGLVSFGGLWAVLTTLTDAAFDGPHPGSGRPGHPLTPSPGGHLPSKLGNRASRASLLLTPAFPPPSFRKGRLLGGAGQSAHAHLHTPPRSPAGPGYV